MRFAIAGLILVASAVAYGEDGRMRPDADPTRPLDVPARALSDYLGVREAGGAYGPIFVKGVNLGAALPGKYPTEFPREVGVYAGWLDTIAGFGANAVRLYTLLPPEFYRALAEHNARPGSRRLWLIQGVWAELPPGDDFSDRTYVHEFSDEIARVIDAVHGDLVAPPRPGHASGTYAADASESVLAFIIGREWEPYAVKAFDEKYPDVTAWTGRFFVASGARAMETWVAQMCDFAAGYEARRYRVLHPLTFANWPTLDPLTHPSESNRSEEDAWRKRYGIPVQDALKEAPWENDAVSLDSTKIAATDEMKAGFFAAYHIYPNYPDFLNQETRYAAYLKDLKRYHGTQPVLVAEFGISTSRGIAHVHPEGWNHGGHDERAQGDLIGTMISTIHEQKLAGGIVFEFMDEWFKGTWSVSPLTIPEERRRLWFNAESPEQSYGLIAQRPASPVRVDGDPSDWKGGAPEGARAPGGAAGWSNLRELKVDSDEGYLYLLLRTGGGPPGPDWESTRIRIAIDTYDPARGVTRLPKPGAATLPTGAEFLIEIQGQDASTIHVAAPYEPYAAADRGPVASPAKGDAARASFVPLMFESNRERFGRDGKRYPAIRVDRGKLRLGTCDPASPDFDTRTDVSIGAATGTVEMRIPWGLLNVTDPSSHRVLHQLTAHEPPYDTIETPGFRIYAMTVDPGHPERPPQSRIPAKGVRAPLYSWPGWEVPRYRTEAKAGVPKVRAAFDAISDRVGAGEPASGGERAR